MTVDTVGSSPVPQPHPIIRIETGDGLGLIEDHDQFFQDFPEFTNINRDLVVFSEHPNSSEGFVFEGYTESGLPLRGSLTWADAGDNNGRPDPGEKTVFNMEVYASGEWDHERPENRRSDSFFDEPEFTDPMTTRVKMSVTYDTDGPSLPDHSFAYNNRQHPAGGRYNIISDADLEQTLDDLQKSLDPDHVAVAPEFTEEHEQEAETLNEIFSPMIDTLIEARDLQQLGGLEIAD